MIEYYLKQEAHKIVDEKIVSCNITPAITGYGGVFASY
jgi:hypothetical protein